MCVSRIKSKWNKKSVKQLGSTKGGFDFVNYFAAWDDWLISWDLKSKSAFKQQNKIWWIFQYFKQVLRHYNWILFFIFNTSSNEANQEKGNYDCGAIKEWFMNDFVKLKLLWHSKLDIEIIYFYSELHIKTRSFNSTLTPI